MWRFSSALASVILGLAVVACDDVGDPRPAPSPPPGDCAPDDPAVQALRTVYFDRDGDGFTVGPAQQVCVDVDATSVPGTQAIERGDDCDDTSRERWQRLPYAGRDEDLDGHAVAAVGEVCAGTGLPERYTLSAEGDCDDADPRAFVLADVYLDADGDGVGSGLVLSRCTDGAVPAGLSARGDDCEPDDTQRWRHRPYTHRDADGDGWRTPESGTLCVGDGLPPGYALDQGLGLDCDDASVTAYRAHSGYPDADGDGVGVPPLARLCAGDSRPEGYADDVGDCAPLDPRAAGLLAYAYRDADGDGATVAQAGTVCAAALPPGYADAPAGDDCDDTEAGIEITRHVYRDDDRDGFGGQDLGVVCTAELLGSDLSERDGDCNDADASAHDLRQLYVDADGDAVGAGPAVSLCTAAVPSGYSDVDSDCAPADALYFRWLTYAGVDADEDGHGRPLTPPLRLCTGAGLLPGYTVSATEDCDDADAAVWQWVAWYVDADGDGVGAGVPTIGCALAVAPPGLSRSGEDPDDNDPQVAEDLAAIMAAIE
jgi:hypothetical protein